MNLEFRFSKSNKLKLVDDVDSILNVNPKFRVVENYATIYWRSQCSPISILFLLKKGQPLEIFSIYGINENSFEWIFFNLIANFKNRVHVIIHVTAERF